MSTIVSFAADVPRITNRGLLLEEAATNLWPRFAPTTAQLSLSANCSDVTAPASPPLAGLQWLALNNAAGAAYAYQNIAGIANSASVALQFLVETPDGSAPVVGATSTTGDFSVLTKGTALTGPFFYERLSGNTWLVTAQGATPVSASVSHGLIRYAGQATRALKFSGFMFEQASEDHSLIVTTGAAATRGADAAKQDLSETPDAIFVAATKRRIGALATLFEVSDGTDANRVIATVAANGAVSASVIVGGAATVIGTTAAGAVTAGVAFKALVRRNLAGTWRLFVNGAAVGAETAVVAKPVCDRLWLGRSWDGGEYLNGVLSKPVLMPLAPSDAAALSMTAL